MSAYDFIDDINDKVREYIERNMQEARASDLGLDQRAGYLFQVDDRTIAVPKYEDSALQYYGGFEYVDKQFRKEVGDYVFYFVDESSTDIDEDTGEEFFTCRVADHLQRLESKKQKENIND